MSIWEKTFARSTKNLKCDENDELSQRSHVTTDLNVFARVAPPETMGRWWEEPSQPQSTPLGIQPKSYRPIAHCRRGLSGFKSAPMKEATPKSYRLDVNRRRAVHLVPAVHLVWDPLGPRKPDQRILSGSKFDPGTFRDRPR